MKQAIAAPMRSGLPFTIGGPAGPAPTVFGIIATGQSLAVGNDGTPVITPTQPPYGNVQLWDNLAIYDTTKPNAPMLTTRPLSTPVRSNVIGQITPTQYPANILGETPEVSMANWLSAFTNRVFATSCIGMAGEPLSAIQKGGSVLSYAAGIYETQALFRLLQHRVLCTLLTHGESDATNAGYGAGILQLQQNFQADCQAITGQSQPIPMILSQQSTFPQVGSGQNLSAMQQVQVVQQNPGVMIGACPKYQYPYNADRIHLTAAGYRLLGEKYAQPAYLALYQYLKTGVFTWSWLPLVPTGFSRNVSTITVTFNVPTLPLVFDGVQSAPHQAGTTYGDNGSIFGVGHTGWTVGKGFELWSGGYGGTPIGISACTISGNTVLVTGANTFDTLAYALTPDNTTPGTNTGGFPDGRCGLLRDSDPWAGPSGTANPNWCWAFQQGGL